MCLSSNAKSIFWFCVDILLVCSLDFHPLQGMQDFLSSPVFVAMLFQGAQGF